MRSSTFIAQLLPFTRRFFWVNRLRAAIAQRLPNVSQRLFPAALAKRTIVESLFTSVPAVYRRLYQTLTPSMRLFANERLISGIA
jgi:hypothetical protein